MGAVVRRAAAPSIEVVDHAATAVQLLRAAQASVDAVATVEQARSAHEQSALLSVLLGQMKAAAELRVEATRLECRALRKVGQLDGLHIFPKASHRRIAAQRLAQMDDARFEEFVSTIESAGSPVTLVFEIKRREDAQRSAERAARHMSRIASDGEYAGAHDAEAQEREARAEATRKRAALSAATGALLAELDMGDLPFSTRELASQVRSEITGEENEYEWADDPELGALIQATVEDGLRATALDLDLDRPTRLTYFDNELGWVRVPWRIASLKHLSAAADYAQSQADEMQMRATKMRELADELASLLRADEPDTVRVSALEQRGARS